MRISRTYRWAFLMLFLCGAGDRAFAQLCAAEAVNKTSVDAGKIIQGCIEKNQDRVIELLPGRYYLKSTIGIRGQKDLTLRTWGTSKAAMTCLSLRQRSNCAVMVADDSLREGPLLESSDATRLTFDHVGLDGNIDQRRARLGNQGWEGSAGYNAVIHRCQDCRFIGFASVRAVSGTGLEFSGDGAVFDHALFRDNGWGMNKYTGGKAWADGLTVHSSRDLVITDSEFSDNSDVNLIIGGAPNGVVQNNVVRSSHNFSFAAIMLDNFNGHTSGDFSGAKIRYNTVDCGHDALCGIGIDLGPKLWYDSAPIHGGEISHNRITGVRQGIGIYGVDGMTLSHNQVDDAGGFQLPDGRCRTSKIDDRDDNRITTDTTGATKNALQGCRPDGLAFLVRSRCDPSTQPYPMWGDKDGRCLKSCGALGGSKAFPDACGPHGMVSVGDAYDAAYCCR